MNGPTKGLSDRGSVPARIWAPPTSFARRNQIVSKGRRSPLSRLAARRWGSLWWPSCPRICWRWGGWRPTPTPVRYYRDKADNKGSPPANLNPSESVLNRRAGSLRVAHIKNGCGGGRKRDPGCRTWCSSELLNCLSADLSATSTTPPRTTCTGPTPW